MMRITGAAYILNGLMACFFGDFFMEQSFGAWTDDPEANELGLYLLDALGGILIGFGIFIVMASLANGRLRCQSIARVIVLASGPALVVSVLHRMMTDIDSTIIIIQLVVLMSAMLGASFVEVEDAPSRHQRRINHESGGGRTRIRTRVFGLEIRSDIQTTLYVQPLGGADHT